jgi:hypothetical protein
MFVRWAVRKRVRRGGSPLLTASLVESRRIDGKPRHRFVGYLGSIRVDYIDNPISVLHRARFWDWAEATLDDLNLPADVRARIEATLESRVPRETEEAVAKMRQA